MEVNPYDVKQNSTKRNPPDVDKSNVFHHWKDFLCGRILLGAVGTTVSYRIISSVHESLYKPVVSLRCTITVVSRISHIVMGGKFVLVENSELNLECCFVSTNIAMFSILDKGSWMSDNASTEYLSSSRMKWLISTACSRRRDWSWSRTFLTEFHLGGLIPEPRWGPEIFLLDFGVYIKWVMGTETTEAFGVGSRSRCRLNFPNVAVAGEREFHELQFETVWYDFVYGELAS